MLRRGLKTACFHSLMHIDHYLKQRDPTAGPRANYGPPVIFFGPRIIIAISVLRFIITILVTNKQICFLGIVYICLVCNFIAFVLCDYFIRKSRFVSSPNLVLYLGCFFAKNIFFFRISICSYTPLLTSEC